MNEFDLIQQFISHQSIHRPDVILGSGDDCAILAVPPNQELLVTTDTLIAGVHFPLETHPYDIGYKSLAVNLSDLAAMGARPAWISLALSTEKTDLDWFNHLAKGFFALANHYEVELIGGDLTRGPLSITITAQGLLPKGEAIRRTGAKVHDQIYVTNHLGDAGLALHILKNQISLPETIREPLLYRLNRPEARVAFGERLRKIAHAAIDISDGFIADLSHILKKSQVGAEIQLESIPLSKEILSATSKEHALSLALQAGDDYELCFTVPSENVLALEKAARDCALQITRVGQIIQEPQLLLTDDGKPYHGKITGYQHF